MHMTKQHFALIASAISDASLEAITFASSNREYQDGARYMRSEIVKHMARALHATNPAFDGERFYEACLARPK